MGRTDFSKAAAFYQKAADQGNTSALNNLGGLYVKGQGVPQNFVKAVSLFQKAADQGSVAAQNTLGVMYENGFGVTKNILRAKELYEIAASQGNILAKKNIEHLNAAITSNGANPITGQQTPDKMPSLDVANTATKEQPFINSLGMKFVPVPGTKVLFSVWDTRVSDYAVFVRETGRTWRDPGFQQGPGHPAVYISWEDAKAFCQWLSQKEGLQYRLPTDEEWSVAVGLPQEVGSTPEEKNGKIKDVYPWGTQWPPPKGAGNYGQSLGVDEYEKTSPVGSFPANQIGLYDMSGNIFQWCEDCYHNGQTIRVYRGPSFLFDTPESLLSSSRHKREPGYSDNDLGFRCVLAPTQETTTIKNLVPPVSASPITTAQSTTATSTKPIETRPFPEGRWINFRKIHFSDDNRNCASTNTLVFKEKSFTYTMHNVMSLLPGNSLIGNPALHGKTSITITVQFAGDIISRTSNKVEVKLRTAKRIDASSGSELTSDKVLNGNGQQNDYNNLIGAVWTFVRRGNAIADANSPKVIFTKSD